MVQIRTITKIFGQKYILCTWESFVWWWWHIYKSFPWWFTWENMDGHTHLSSTSYLFLSTFPPKCFWFNIFLLPNFFYQNFLPIFFISFSTQNFLSNIFLLTNFFTNFFGLKICRPNIFLGQKISLKIFFTKVFFLLILTSPTSVSVKLS